MDEGEEEEEGEEEYPRGIIQQTEYEPLLREEDNAPSRSTGAEEGPQDGPPEVGLKPGRRKMSAHDSIKMTCCDTIYLLA